MGKSNDELDLVDSDEELDNEEEQDEQDEAEDRGDDLNPEDKDTKGLKKVAGDEDEDDEDEPEEDEAPAARARKSPPPLIPKDRFDELARQRDTERAERLRLEEENARLKGAAAGGGKGNDEADAPAFDIDAKEEEHANALMEGDTKKAAALRKEINAELMRQAEAAADARAERRLSEREAELDFKAAVAESFKAFPFLYAGTKDKPNPNANREAIADVVELRDAYIQGGKSPAEALRKAVSKIGPLHAPAKKKGKPEVADEDEDEADADDGANLASVSDRLKARRAAALGRNAKAAGSQPASAGNMGAGNRGKTTGEDVDVEDMTEDEFEKLPASEKKKLRGD